MKTKRGMSGILTVLIIIAIALAVIGIIWLVIQNLVSGTRAEIDQSSSDLWSTCPASNVTTEGNTTACPSPSEVRIVGGEYCCMTA